MTLHISGSIDDDMIVICGAHVWNDDISRCFFHFFKILISRVRRGKKWPKMVKRSVCLTLYLRNHTAYDCGFCRCGKWWYLQHFIHFFKILIFCFFWEVKGKKMTRNYQFQSVALYISRTVDDIIRIFGTQV